MVGLLGALHHLVRQAVAIDVGEIDECADDRGGRACVDAAAQDASPSRGADAGPDAGGVLDPERVAVELVPESTDELVAEADVLIRPGLTLPDDLAREPAAQVQLGDDVPVRIGADMVR
jgi:hypothetical protein